MKLTQIGIIVGAIIGFNADPLPTSAPEPGPGVKEGTTDLGIAGKVAAIEPLAMDNTAVWQMGNGDQANVLINGNSNTTYTEFSNSSVDRNDVAIDIWGDGNYVETIVNTDVGGGDRNDVDIDLMNSNDNRIFTLQTGSYSNATVDLTNSNMNQLMVEQTSYDNAVVLGNGANGNVGLIYQN
ncbi:hypothetical protein AB6D15_24755 [Vibrio splendidus]